MTKPPWREKFDFVVAVCTPSRMECVSSLRAELKRVGLDVDLWQWGRPLLWEDRMSQIIVCHSCVSSANPGMRNSTIGHMTAINTAFQLRKKRLLIIEDDIRFVSDLERLAYLIDTMPEDSNVVQMDIIPSGKGGRASSPWIDIFNEGGSQLDNPRWVSDVHVDCCSFACVGLDRVAQEWMMAIERGIWCSGARPLDSIDITMRAGWIVGGHMLKSVPIPLVARQVDVGNVIFNSTLRRKRRYHHSGCPFSEWYDKIGATREMYGE